MKGKRLIYSLTKNGCIFYIGSTGNPEIRLYEHKRRFGANIEMNTIEYAYGMAKSIKRESYWIRHYTSIGIKLENLCLFEPKNTTTVKISSDIRYELKRYAIKKNKKMQEVLDEAVLNYINSN